MADISLLEKKIGNRSFSNINRIRKKILVVDDTPFMRIMLRTFLQPEGFDIFEAIDGKECLSEYTIHQPDLILLDILMPRMDGIATLQTLLSYHPNAKVIIVSSVDNVEMIELAFKRGAVAYIMKPFQRTHLVEEVKRVLNLNKINGFADTLDWRD